MQFDLSRFQALYPTQPLPTLYVYEHLASTNQTAWELIQSGATTGHAVLALTQTAGRGQWGRSWTSSMGGLYLSIILEPDVAATDSAQLTLCTAWGIARTLRDRHLPVELKWPNDLVLRGRKLGGILTETRLQQGRIRQAVVGVGINWANEVPETGIALQTYFRGEVEDSAIDRLEALCAVTLSGVLSGYAHWQSEGIEAIVPQYCAWLTHRDRPIEVAGQMGQIVGVTTTGDLRVQLLGRSSERTDSSDDFSRCDSPQTVLSEPTFSEVHIQPGTIKLGYLFNET